MPRSNGTSSRILSLTRHCRQCGKAFHPWSGRLNTNWWHSQRCYRTWLRRPEKERFLALVVKGQHPDDCWGWTGYINPRNGYSSFHLNDGRSYNASRASWILHHGPIPKGLHVLHNCPTGDDPRCTNPRHLFLGTAADNIQDAARKGRVKRGEQHHKTTLTEADVRAIRASSEPTVAIARRFGVRHSCISRIRNRVRWKHVI